MEDIIQTNNWKFDVVLSFRYFNNLHTESQFFKFSHHFFWSWVFLVLHISWVWIFFKLLHCNLESKETFFETECWLFQGVHVKLFRKGYCEMLLWCLLCLCRSPQEEWGNWSAMVGWMLSLRKRLPNAVLYWRSGIITLSIMKCLCFTVDVIKSSLMV